MATSAGETALLVGVLICALGSLVVAMWMMYKIGMFIATRIYGYVEASDDATLEGVDYEQ